MKFLKVDNNKYINTDIIANFKVDIDDTEPSECYFIINIYTKRQEYLAPFKISADTLDNLIGSAGVI